MSDPWIFERYAGPAPFPGAPGWGDTPHGWVRHWWPADPSGRTLCGRRLRPSARLLPLQPDAYEAEEECGCCRRRLGPCVADLLAWATEHGYGIDPAQAGCARGRFHGAVDSMEST